MIVITLEDIIGTVIILIMTVVLLLRIGKK